MSEITLITDGSANNATGSGGWAAIVRTSNSLVELVGYADNTTSNRMELTAAMEGLKAISVPSKVILIADSSYLLKTLRHKWYQKWIVDDWKRAEPRPNMDLWHQLIGLTQFHDVSYVKIKGHSGDYWNERADRLADHARRNKVSSRNEIAGFTGVDRCDNLSPSNVQCKLHLGHTGRHYWTNGVANGVVPYGSSTETSI